MLFHTKSTSFLAAGTIVLSALLPGVALANSASSSTMAPTHPTTHAEGMTNSTTKQSLNLSESQKKQIQTIRISRLRQINQVLTTAQRTKLQQELKSGKKLGASLTTLNLNADQKKKITTIMQKSNQQAMGVLTAQQRQQLTEAMRQHRSGAHSPLEQ